MVARECCLISRQQNCPQQMRRERLGKYAVTNMKNAASRRMLLHQFALQLLNEQIELRKCAFCSVLLLRCSPQNNIDGYRIALPS